MRYLMVMNKFKSKKKTNLFCSLIFQKFRMRKWTNKRRNVVQNESKSCRSKFLETSNSCGNLPLTGISSPKVWSYSDTSGHGFNK